MFFITQKVVLRKTFLKTVLRKMFFRTVFKKSFSSYVFQKRFFKMVFPRSLSNAGSAYGFLGTTRRERLIQIVWDHRPDREDGVRGSTRHRAWFRKNKAMKKAIKKEYGNPILMFFLSIIIQAIVNAIIKKLTEE